MNFSKLNCVCSLIIYRNIINICTKNINCSVLSNLSIQLPLKDSNFFRNKRSFRSNENTEVNIHTYANKIYSVGSNGKWIARRNARNYASASRVFLVRATSCNPLACYTCVCEWVVRQLTLSPIAALALLFVYICERVERILCVEIGEFTYYEHISVSIKMCECM